MFNLITTIYDKINSIKLEEFLFCIKNNITHPLIKSIHIMYENNSNNTIIKNKILEINNKITIVDISTRPSFGELFEYCNKYENELWILCNGDIYYPHWNIEEFKNLLLVDYNSDFIVLTRYDDSSYYDKKWAIYTYKYNNIIYKSFFLNSIDTWIFKSKIKISKNLFKIHIGLPKCDPFSAYEIAKYYRVVNLCKHIISVHHHNNWNSSWYCKYNEYVKNQSKQDILNYKIYYFSTKLKNNLLY